MGYGIEVGKGRVVLGKLDDKNAAPDKSDRHKPSGSTPSLKEDTKVKTEKAVWLDALHGKETAAAPRRFTSVDTRHGAERLTERTAPRHNNHDLGAGRDAVLDGFRTSRLDGRESAAGKLGISPEKGQLTPEQKQVAELFKNPAILRAYMINPDQTAKTLGEKFPGLAKELEINKPFSIVDGRIEVNKESRFYKAIEAEVKNGVKSKDSPIRNELDKLLSSGLPASMGGSAGLETKAYDLIRERIDHSGKFTKSGQKLELKIAKLMESPQAKADLRELSAVQGIQVAEQKHVEKTPVAEVKKPLEAQSTAAQPAVQKEVKVEQQKEAPKPTPAATVESSKESPKAEVQPKAAPVDPEQAAADLKRVIENPLGLPPQTEAPVAQNTAPERQPVPTFNRVEELRSLAPADRVLPILSKVCGEECGMQIYNAVKLAAVQIPGVDGSPEVAALPDDNTVKMLEKMRTQFGGDALCSKGVFNYAALLLSGREFVPRTDKGDSSSYNFGNLVRADQRLLELATKQTNEQSLALAE